MSNQRTEQDGSAAPANALERLADAAAIRAATGDDPVARGSATWLALRGWRAPGAVAWTGRRAGRPDPGLAAVGDAPAVAALLDRLAVAGELPAAELRAILPFGTADHLALLPVDPRRPPAHWDHLVARSAPPAQPAEPLVRWLGADEAGAVRALLDAAYPDSMARPGSAQVRRWAGVFDGGRLVACGADTSIDHRTGHLSGITTHPAARRRGLGMAVTAFMTRAAFTAGADVVTLGLWAWNDGARRIYERLGFGNARRFTTQWLLADQPSRSTADEIA